MWWVGMWHFSAMFARLARLAPTALALAFNLLCSCAGM
jgi:hypothetical protein